MSPSASDSTRLWPPVVPDHHDPCLLTVPVVGTPRTWHLQVHRLRDGRRVVVAFTTQAQARAVLGEHQLLVDLSLGSLVAMTEALGWEVRVDPVRVLARPGVRVA